MDTTTIPRQRGQTHQNTAASNQAGPPEPPDRHFAEYDLHARPVESPEEGQTGQQQNGIGSDAQEINRPG